MRLQKLLVAAVAVGSWVAGCASEPDPHTDVTAADGEVWAVASEPRLSIGVVDGPGEYQLSDVSAAARQSDGDLVVADAGARTVRLYGPDGGFKTLLGGAGDGPGEFMNPTQILIGAADSIFIWDDAAYRMTAFGPDGTFNGVHTFGRETIANAITAPLYPGPAQLLSDRSLLVRLVEKTGKGAAKRESPFRRRSGAIRVSADLSEIDTVAFFGDVEQAIVKTPAGSFSVDAAMARNTSIAVQPTEPRACIGEQEGPAVVCYDQGTEPITIRWESRQTGLAPDPDAVAAWREATMDLYTRKMSRQSAERLIDQIPIPAQAPEYSGLVLDHRGNLWVVLGHSVGGRSSEASLDTIEHLVFDPAGRRLGSVFLPPMRVLQIGPDYVIGVQADDLEIQYLRVFDLVRTS